MEEIRHLTPVDADYPDRVRALPNPPAHLSVRGRLDRAFCIAIVGARKATPDAARYANDLGGMLARLGIVVISGGAIGVDAAAHRGAMEAGGRTWAVAGTGAQHVFPPQHGELYESIVESGGALIWPFPPTQPSAQHTFLSRNRVLVALADVIVVVQAGRSSGALNAAACARRAGRPLWVVPGAPWLPEFQGGAALLERALMKGGWASAGVRPLTSTKVFLESLGQTGMLFPSACAEPASSLPTTLTDDEKALAEAASSEPKHGDELAAAAGLSAGAAATALLTLALENVLVEGPGGFYRRTGP